MANYEITTTREKIATYRMEKKFMEAYGLTSSALARKIMADHEELKDGVYTKDFIEDEKTGLW